MGLVIGVDPGINGALATYDANYGLVSLIDMPAWHMPVGKKTRKRVDAVELADFFDTAKLLGVEIVVIEAVGGRPRQSASGGFVFGYTVGLIYMACIQARIPIETVPPTDWKKLLNVPGKSKANDDAIMARADELFPDHRHLMRGPKGGKMVDRAEAAMLALFGTRYLTGDKGVKTDDSEYETVYRNADTGG